ncbi:hypothetical protein AB0B85_06485 [Micromonospora sp. NPDC049044]|uniref:hypothetical protein n=1 Tax=Micromonospora sp. NPDC049044 TaxID=3154827 RepID=UPI0033C20A22
MIPAEARLIAATEKLLSSLAGSSLEDVHIPGFLDQVDGIGHFVPLAQQVYLVFGDRLLLLDSAERGGFLTLRIVTSIDVPEALQGEEENFSVGAVGSLFMDNSGANLRLVKVRFALDSDHDPGLESICAAEFCFSGGNTLFVDPLWHLGIRLGGAGAFDEWWLRAGGESGSMEEFSWVPSAG